jgi:hypothetical protein
MDVKSFLKNPQVDLYYKTYYGHDLLIFEISYSVCPWQAFPA